MNRPKPKTYFEAMQQFNEAYDELWTEIHRAAAPVVMPVMDGIFWLIVKIKSIKWGR